MTVHETVVRITDAIRNKSRHHYENTAVYVSENYRVVIRHYYKGFAGHQNNWVECRVPQSRFKAKDPDKLIEVLEFEIAVAVAKGTGQ